MVTGMARFFDSEHAFFQRLKDLSLSDLEQKFKDKGWTFSSVLAFVTDFVPGTSSPCVLLYQALVG